MIADFNEQICCLRLQIPHLYHLPINLNPFYIFPPTRLYLRSSIHKIHVMAFEAQGFSHRQRYLW